MRNVTEHHEEWRILPYHEDYDWIRDKLTENFERLVLTLLGEPTRKEDVRWWYGDTFAIFPLTDKTMIQFFDYETEDCGDFLFLVMLRKRFDYGKELNDWIGNFLGYSEPERHKTNEPKWVPIMPIPVEVYGSFETQFPCGVILPKPHLIMGFETLVNSQNVPIGIGVRYPKKNDIVLKTLLYCHDEEWNESWRWQEIS